MVSFLQRSCYFDCTDKAPNKAQEYHTTREVTKSLAGNSFSTRNIRYQPDNPVQPILHDCLMTVASLQTYLSSALKIKKIWQSFIDLVKDSQSLQGISQFFTKKFKGISISAIQLNAYFSFFKRKEIHHHNTEINNHNGASKEDLEEIYQKTVQAINDLKDQLFAQNRTMIELLSQKNEELVQKLEELSQKNEELVQKNKELSQREEQLTQKLEAQPQEIMRMNDILTNPSIGNPKESIRTLNTTTQPSRGRASSWPTKFIAHSN